jgi:hypothetical protein
MILLVGSIDVKLCLTCEKSTECGYENKMVRVIFGPEGGEVLFESNHVGYQY